MATLGRATAYYVATERADDFLGEFDEISQICNTTRDLVALDIWKSPLSCKIQGDYFHPSTGLAFEEVYVEPRFRGEGIGHSRYLLAETLQDCADTDRRLRAR